MDIPNIANPMTNLPVIGQGHLGSVFNPQPHEFRQAGKHVDATAKQTTAPSWADEASLAAAVNDLTTVTHCVLGMPKRVKERKAFAVSVPSQSQVKEVDYFGLVSGRDIDKFAATGWTPVRSGLVDTPYVQECPLVLECKVLHVHDLGLHTQFVGQILDVKTNEAVLDAAGMPDILKILPIIFSPGNRVYYGVGGSLGHAFAVGKEI